MYASGAVLLYCALNIACHGIVFVQKLNCKSLDMVNYFLGKETGWNLALETLKALCHGNLFILYCCLHQLLMI